jgi:predicted nucleic-acid-binding Zn-ribbon protein
MEDKRNQKQHLREQKCPICGATEYEWGRLAVGKSVPGQSALFRPIDSTWNDDDVAINARRCVDCGNVQFFTVES